jgi:hypothetical protein
MLQRSEAAGERSVAKKWCERDGQAGGRTPELARGQEEWAQRGEEAQPCRAGQAEWAGHFGGVAQYACHACSHWAVG